jgi:hypothetical protein
MADEEAIRRKHKLLASEMLRYFLETCPALTARWQTVIVGLAPPILRELARRLQALEAVTNETNRELKASLLAAREGRQSAEHLLDRALALAIQHAFDSIRRQRKTSDACPPARNRAMGMAIRANSPAEEVICHG